MSHDHRQDAPSISLSRFSQSLHSSLVRAAMLASVLLLCGCPGDSANEPPVATNDEVSMEEDSGARNITVLANDTDADNDELTVVLVTPPDNGTAVRNADNTITYTPNANFSGTDTFVYRIDDAQGDTALATVVVTVTPEDTSGTVYAMTNALGNNEILAFHRANDGTLTPLQRIATGGGGSGVQLDPTDSLGSQGVVLLNQSHTLLFAANTETLAEDPLDGIDIGDCETGTLTSFRVAVDGRLTRLGSVPSGGLFPASLAIRDNVLYVLNAGGPGLNPVCGIEPNITAFTIAQDGQLTALLNSTQPVDPGSSPGSFLNCDPGGGPFPSEEFRCGLNPPAFPRSPAQIGVTPDGASAIVTVKGTNAIHVYPLDQNGIPGPPVITQAQGPNQPTFFGFGFDRAGNLIVAEPFGATPNIPAVPFSALSSFAVNANGTLQAISTSVPNGRGTACWIALDPDQQYVYTTNNATSDISSYTVGTDGSLTLLEAIAAPAAHPSDITTVGSNGSRFLYVLDSGDGTVGAFRINADGSLTEIDRIGGLPIDAGAQGLAAY